MSSNVATKAEALYQRALSVYQRSGLIESELLCKAALELKPRDFKALHLLGVIAAQSNDAAGALKLLEEALLVNPRSEIAHNNLGNVLASLNRFEAAIGSYDKAIALNRRFADAFYNRGNALAGLKKYSAAIENYNRAISLKNDFVEAYYNRGNAHSAVRSFELALKSYDQAIAIKPSYAEAHSNRGCVLKELNHLPAALESCNRAIALKPRYVEAHANRGAVLKELNDLSGALASYDDAIAGKSDYAEAFSGRGNVFKGLNQLDASIANYNRALALDPGYVDAIYNRSLVYLLSGDFEKGWTDYESRWQSESAARFNEKRSFKQPLWLGNESLKGKTILIYGEQGLGDRIQFSRYVKSVADLDAKVILEVPRALLKVLSRLDGLCQIVEKGMPLPDFDLQCPMLTLPLALKTRLSTIPLAKGYLSSDELSVQRWHEKLRGSGSPRIGLVWSGSKLHLNDRNRSMTLARLLRALPNGLQYISLQKEVRDHDLETLKSNHNILDISENLTDFSDTAAACECMDLIISVDTSVAHLSGALGKRTWILLPFAPDWRWLLERDDCPWYSAVKLYRQQSHDDWDATLERVNADLKSEFQNTSLIDLTPCLVPFRSRVRS